MAEITELEQPEEEEIILLDYYAGEIRIGMMKGENIEEYNKRMEKFTNFTETLDEKGLEQKQSELKKALEAIDQSIINQGWYLIETPDREGSRRLDYTVFAKGILQDQIKLISEKLDSTN